MRIYVDSPVETLPAVASFAAVAGRLHAWLARRREAARITRELGTYSDHGLADLGLSRSDIPSIAHGRMWRD